MNTSRLLRNGMTAIEVLVATMLAALMLAAVAGLLGTLSRQERELRAHRDTSQWHQQLTEQLLLDLRNARRFAISGDCIWLEGYGARDFATARPTGDAASIQYYLVESGADRSLVRRESHPGDHTNQSARVDLMCRGTESFNWGEKQIGKVAAAAPQRPKDELFMSVPDQVHVQFYIASVTTAAIDQVLCIR